MSDEVLEDVAVASPEPGPDVRRSARGQLGQLWASIFFAPETKVPKTLLVTSAERHEGATQIAAGLGIVGAQSNSELNVLLVDFNLHHPQLPDVLGARPDAGLAEVLRGGAGLDDAVCATGQPNVHLLSAGREVDHPLGLLRSKQLQTVMSQLQDYALADHIIIDTAAANRYPEAQTLAGLVDGVILVTRAGVTRRESIGEAKKRIEQNQGRLLGVVLNQQRYVIPGFIYRRL